MAARKKTAKKSEMRVATSPTVPTRDLSVVEPPKPTGSPPKPLGWWVLVEIIEVEEMTAGGIVLPQNTQDKEQKGVTQAYVRDFGKMAFTGFRNSEGPKDWGVEIGDLVEFRRYETLATSYSDLWRLVPDTSLVAVG